MPRVEMVVARLAERRLRIVTGAELERAGLTRSAVRHSLACGRLQRLHRGVFLVGPGPVDLEQREMAAVLAYGEGTVLGLQSAARRWGLPLPAPAEIHVMTTTPRKPRDGVRPHHLTLLAGQDVRRHRGLAVTSPARTLLDLAGTPERDRLVAEALGTQLVTRRELERVVDRHPNHPGAAALSDALRGDTGYTRSEAERKLLALIRSASLPLPETNVVLHGYEVDALWREERLIVEVDGFHHHAQRQKFERDRIRDVRLARALPA